MPSPNATYGTPATGAARGMPTTGERDRRPTDHKRDAEDNRPENRHALHANLHPQPRIENSTSHYLVYSSKQKVPRVYVDRRLSSLYTYCYFLSLSRFCCSRVSRVKR